MTGFLQEEPRERNYPGIFRSQLPNNLQWLHLKLQPTIKLLQDSHHQDPLPLPDLTLLLPHRLLRLPTPTNLCRCLDSMHLIRTHLQEECMHPIHTLTTLLSRVTLATCQDSSHSTLSSSLQVVINLHREGTTSSNECSMYCSSHCIVKLTLSTYSEHYTRKPFLRQQGRKLLH